MTADSKTELITVQIKRIYCFVLEKVYRMVFCLIIQQAYCCGFSLLENLYTMFRFPYLCVWYSIDSHTYPYAFVAYSFNSIILDMEP